LNQARTGISSPAARQGRPGSGLRSRHQRVHVRNGDRNIAYSTDKIDIEEVCARIDRLLPELGFASPGRVRRNGPAQRSEVLREGYTFRGAPRD